MKNYTMKALLLLCLMSFSSPLFAENKSGHKATLEIGGLRCADRQFKVTTIPETLKGFKCYPINRGDKMKPGAGMTFKLSAPTEVYLAVMDRGNPTLGQAWEKTDMKLDWMGDHVPFTDLIYKKSAPAGLLTVPEHQGLAGKKKKTFGIPHLLIVPTNIEVSISPSKKQVKKMIPIHRDKLKPGGISI